MMPLQGNGERLALYLAKRCWHGRPIGVVFTIGDVMGKAVVQYTEIRLG